ncbi:MAG: FtsX-like permease family protein [Firmicutes bacterium]|nr:FtsX-like permease family protein [Bacillota bacterium]
MIRNSIRQLMRTPRKTILFLLLILAAGMLLTLGGALWILNSRNIKAYEQNFITIGTVEQKATSISQIESWDYLDKEYRIFQRPVYGELIPPTVLDFNGADYIQKPEKRPYYGSYSPEYKFDKGSYSISVVEITPLEDGIPNQPVEVMISRILFSDQVREGQTIRICDESLVDPKPLYKGRTYVLGINEMLFQNGNDWVTQYLPTSVIVSRQYYPNGTLIPSELTDDTLYYEVTEEFYKEEIGKRFLEYAKSLKQFEQALPVTGTNATILLMPFYEKDAYLCQGRDITEEEYEKGEKVCLISQKFAKNNQLTVGEDLHLQLYYANYRNSTAGDYFDNAIIAELNAKGEAYPVFEDSYYTIVGIYDIDSGVNNGVYGLAKNEVIIPSESIENSDSNNILSYGPMKSDTTSFQIPNGSVEEFMKQWGKLGYDQLEIKFYDRGYSTLKAGMDNMKNMSMALMAVGFVMVIFILLFFSHLFITKQVRRTAIERSLGMSRGECMGSLLIGILVILILGSALGSMIGGVFSLSLSRKNISGSYYNTMYSGVMIENQADTNTDANTRDPEEDIPFIILIGALSTSLIILMGVGISVYKINRNLKQEPMELLSRQKE